jgi:hypothetical protein
MMVYFEIQKFTHRTLDLLYSWITKLKNMFAVLADQVIMLFE